MKIVNLAVKIIEQIRMPVIRYKPVLFTAQKAEERVCHICTDNIDFANTFSCTILQL